MTASVEHAAGLNPDTEVTSVTPALIDPVVMLGVAVAALRSLDFPRDVIVESIHNAFLVDVPEEVTADVLDAVQRGANEIRVRQPHRVDLTRLADEYRPMTHPEEWCYKPYCLAEVEIDDVTGRAWHNRGVHRRDVRSIELEYGVLAQVGVGVADDFDLIVDEPFVHTWIADLDGNDDAAYELQLSESEADTLGSFLKGAAAELRAAKDRVAREAAEVAVDAFFKQKFPNLVAAESAAVEDGGGPMSTPDDGLDPVRELIAAMPDPIGFLEFALAWIQQPDNLERLKGGESTSDASVVVHPDGGYEVHLS